MIKDRDAFGFRDMLLHIIVSEGEREVSSLDIASPILHRTSGHIQ